MYGDYPDLSHIKKILVIKLRQLGDVLLATPVLSVLKERLPRAEIDAYVYADSIPLLARNPVIRQCLGYDRSWKRLGLFKRFLREAGLLKSIRREGYDLVVNLTEGDRGAIAARVSQAPIRVGFDPKRSGFLGKSSLYTHIVKPCPGLRHTVERNLDALRRIGLFPSYESRELAFSVCPNALARMRTKVPARFWLIHPTSRWLFKCWPPEKMRAFSEALLAQDIPLVFTSGPDSAELAMVRQIVQGLDVVNLAGTLTLDELAALVALSERLVCVDSLPFHLASALKHPVIALFGPTSDVTWGPWRNPHATVVTQTMSCRPCYMDGCGGSKKSDCLETLSVEQVLLVLNKNS